MPLPASLGNLADHIPWRVRDALRPVARWVGVAAPAGHWSAQASPPWVRYEGKPVQRWCNICHWTGTTFEGMAHTESAECPQCGSIARDRFLLWCCTSRTSDLAGRRVIETSPRLGEEYRSYMRRWFSYRTSDFDLSMHTGDIQLDLQNIELPDASVDIVLTPHVLEHVPDTDKAIAELHHVIAPGGRMYLQVPLVYGSTAAPLTPEFHADNTPVFWNFGWDLTDRLRDGGFQASPMVTQEYASVLRGDLPPPDSHGDGFHIDSLLEHARPDDLVIAATGPEARLMGYEPAYHFATWECLRH